MAAAPFNPTPMSLTALTRMTVADALRQPVTWMMTGLSIILLGLSYMFGMFNFETEDRLRMLATTGASVAILNGLFLGVLGVSQGIHDELASRTALTLFAKPLSRGAFLGGKILGSLITVAASATVILGAHLILLWMAGRTSFEGSLLNPRPDEIIAVPWASVIAAHGLALCHSGVLASAAAILALRLPLAANILGCFALFIAGHLLSASGILGGVVIPGLAVFNIDDSIQLTGTAPSPAYLLGAVLYSALFGTGCWLIGLALFQRQDIP